MKEYRVIVAHPGKQHSFRLASALKKEGVLFKYITTVYNKESSLWMKFVKKFLGEDNLKRANGRKCENLNDGEVMQFYEILGLLTLLVLRLDRTNNIYRWLNRFVSNSFGKKVARYAIKNNVDAVIMYDSTATKCFEILNKKAPHIRRILDASIANRIHTKEIYDQEIKTTGVDEYIKENKYMWNQKLMKYFDKEIEYTQDYIVPSSYVKESYMYSGVKSEQIYVVPYGFNISNNTSFKTNKDNKSVNFLFVGQVIYRKGINYLLEAFMNISRNDIFLYIVGKVDENMAIIKKAKLNDNIRIMGLVTHDKMKKIYEEADVFVLPSLSEGMSLAGLEAMACRLPIICTTNTGVNDLIIEGENGFVIPISNSDAIKEKIVWFADNIEKINSMGDKAQEVVSEYSWNNYERNIVNVVNNIIEGRLMHEKTNTK